MSLPNAQPGPFARFAETLVFGNRPLVLIVFAASTVAMSAIPIGAPGWPDLACCTASIANTRMAFASTCCCVTTAIN